MKKLVTTIFIALIALLYSHPSNADWNPSNALQIIVSGTSTGNGTTGPDDEPITPSKGQRTSAASLLCTISSAAGVTIAGVDSDDLYFYEIYTEDDCLLASFSDADSFIAHLSSLNGVYLLRFHTTDYIYSGYLEL